MTAVDCSFDSCGWLAWRAVAVGGPLRAARRRRRLRPRGWLPAPACLHPVGEATKARLPTVPHLQAHRRRGVSLQSSSATRRQANRPREGQDTRRGHEALPCAHGRMTGASAFGCAPGLPRPATTRGVSLTREVRTRQRAGKRGTLEASRRPGGATGQCTAARGEPPGRMRRAAGGQPPRTAGTPSRAGPSARPGPPTRGPLLPPAARCLRPRHRRPEPAHTPSASRRRRSPPVGATFLGREGEK